MIRAVSDKPRSYRLKRTMFIQHEERRYSCNTTPYDNNDSRHVAESRKSYCTQIVPEGNSVKSLRCTVEKQAKGHKKKCVDRDLWCHDDNRRDR